ncbi:hypothetical protein NDU88_005036 [Pleurodeles waltl]|uniref:Uncharacterized protein n=1 Tax=Pleurodeles waltl TaxID=8319 RepID=A0AAV7QHP7_PLEWA|nr:hypothetical protein NDU88_005036 [Pleurodeles waltl]
MGCNSGAAGGWRLKTGPAVSGVRSQAARGPSPALVLPGDGTPRMPGTRTAGDFTVRPRRGAVKQRHTTCKRRCAVWWCGLHYAIYCGAQHHHSGTWRRLATRGAALTKI